MKRIISLHVAIIAAIVVGFIAVMFCYSAEARHPRLLAQRERSVLVSRDDKPVPPPPDVNVSEWHYYVARVWRLLPRDDCGFEMRCATDRATLAGSTIDLYTWRQGTGGEKCHCYWEFARPYNYKNAIGRIMRIKWEANAGLVGIILVTDGSAEDTAYVREAIGACRAAGVMLQTVDRKGVIR